MDIFKTSPEREIRLIRYAIFQSIFTDKIGARTRLPRDDASRTSEKLNASISILMANPLDERLRAETISRFQAGLSDFPNSLIFQFEFARLLWVLGDKETAYRHFQQSQQLAVDGTFNPMQERLYFHLLGAQNEMTPYEDYYAALVKDQVSEDAHFSAGRKIIQATSDCYIGLFHLQNNDIDAGLKALRATLETCPVHFPAARLNAKALYGADYPADEIAAAVYQCLSLYPPYLTELLPYVVAAEKSLDNEEAALSVVRDWAYFITRVTWLRPKEHPISELTWQAAMNYLDRLPPKLQTTLKQRYDDWLTQQTH